MNTTEIRSHLQNRRAELLDRLKRLTIDVRHGRGLEADFEEQAVERENDDVLVKLDASVREEIREIERAVARIDQSRYGICDGCQRPIPAKRLTALPYVTRCLKCES